MKGLVRLGEDDNGDAESVSPWEDVDDLGSLEEVTEVKIGKKLAEAEVFKFGGVENSKP